MLSKVEIGLLVFIILAIVALALGLGLGLGLKSNSIAPSQTNIPEISNVPVTTQAPNPIDSIKLQGSIDDLYTKLSDGISPSDIPGAPMNFLRNLVNRNIESREIPTTFDFCLPGMESIGQFSAEAIQMIANTLNISSDCIQTTEINIENPSMCLTNGSKGYIVVDNNVISFVFSSSVETPINDIQIKQIIYNLNQMYNSSNYVVLFITNQMKQSTVGLEGTIVIIDTSTNLLDMTRDTRSDDEMNKFSVIYGGREQALERYKTSCNNIPIPTPRMN